MLSYDVWCQYSIKLRKRFAKWFPRLVPLIDRMRGAIPKMHIRNHISTCQFLYSFGLTPYSGEGWGELIESAWGEQNQNARSTKEQNEGHRHDSLDDACGSHNWEKLYKLGVCLCK
jgi:hypothetical protein